MGETAEGRQEAEDSVLLTLPGVLGERRPRARGQPHLLQQPALLAQAGLHLRDDLLEPAPLLLHVPLLPVQPLLQCCGQPTGAHCPPTFPP